MFNPRKLFPRNIHATNILYIAICEKIVHLEILALYSTKYYMYLSSPTERTLPLVPGSPFFHAISTGITFKSRVKGHSVLITQEGETEMKATEKLRIGQVYTNQPSQIPGPLSWCFPSGRKG